VVESCLSADLEKWRKNNPDDTLFILHEDHKPDLELPHVDGKRLRPAIDRCRVIKDAHEIKCIRTANEISARAHRAVLENLHGFTNEAQIRGLFENVCISNFAKPAYGIIAASGANASTLHYTDDNESIKGRQLVCLDAGAEYHDYASDVTRTFPVSGSWPSAEAKSIYGIVREMQETCIKQLAPGVRMYDVHVLAHKIAIRGLLALGVLRDGAVDEIYAAGTSRGFFPHGLGHHMGLEVHDVDGLSTMRYLRRDDTDFHVPCPLSAHDQPRLEEGMVVTVEPGIYFSRYELERAYLSLPKHARYIDDRVLDRYWPVGGVRIEDDILITATGYENLTTAPKGELAMEIIRNGARGCRR
jgi:Xaa-Pro dipeptidase